LNLCKKLDNPQDKIKAISVVGTNGKYSTIQAMYAILKEAKLNCNIYTSPHIKKINERFVFNNKELSDDELSDLLEQVEKVNDNQPITFFEILTAAYFYKSAEYPNNINLIETGLFHRFDATNILNQNLASVVTSIGLDHLDWLPKNEQTIEKIIFEKTSKLLNSNIIVAKQSSNETLEQIEKTIKDNKSNKLFFSKDYNYSANENSFFYYEDMTGGIKLPKPNVNGQFQLENISTAIATLRLVKEININDEHIKNGITKIKSIARLQEITEGKLKDLVEENRLFVDGSHNPLGAKVLNDYLGSLNCNKHVVLGMMANKDHQEYMSYFKDITTLTTIDIPNQPNSIGGMDLKNKLNNFGYVQYKENIFEAIKSIPVKKNDLILITGSLYLAGEVLNLN
jgi:dihydrofolate synthase/folylpolyglutamate synthase